MFTVEKKEKIRVFLLQILFLRRELSHYFRILMTNMIAIVNFIYICKNALNYIQGVKFRSNYFIIV
jgi:hypothetical protein